MRGHQPIIAMRRRGITPALVQIGTDEPAGLRMWRDWPELCPAVAWVQIDADEVAAALDLRFVTALTVSVTGSNPDRVEAVAQACRDHHADRVIAVCTEQHGECSVIGITDTEGMLTWPN